MIRRNFPQEHNVYFRQIVFLYGTREEINRWGRREHDDQVDIIKPKTGGGWTLYVRNGVEIDVIGLEKGNGPVVEIGSLVHEVVHHAVYVFTLVGAPIKDQQDEPFCYYVQHIVGLCLQAIRGKR